MLRPAVQPGSRVDYTLPPEKVAHPLLRKNTNPEVMQVVEPKEGRPFSVEATIITGIPKMTRPIYFETEEDASARPLQLHRFLLPYAELNRSAEPVAREIPEINGGSWARGREVFFGPQANCAKCHKVNGAGGAIGPDLSNLIHRDYDSVLRDIRFPSVAINPDHLT